jgi:hypothetical protein
VTLQPDFVGVGFGSFLAQALVRATERNALRCCATAASISRAQGTYTASTAELAVASVCPKSDEPNNCPFGCRMIYYSAPLQEGTVLRDGVLRLRKGYEWSDPSDRTKGAVQKALRPEPSSPLTRDGQLLQLDRSPIELQGIRRRCPLACSRVANTASRGCNAAAVVEPPQERRRRRKLTTAVAAGDSNNDRAPIPSLPDGWIKKIDPNGRCRFTRSLGHEGVSEPATRRRVLIVSLRVPS